MPLTVRALVEHPVPQGPADSENVGTSVRLLRLLPLLLDDEEAVAVAVGLRTAAASAPSSGIEETSMRALAKLEQMLPSRLRPHTSGVQWAMESVAGRGPIVDVDTLTAAAASRDHHQARSVS
jgi:predicted DNA-binding transcriptional regulator YafY